MKRFARKIESEINKKCSFNFNCFSDCNKNFNFELFAIIKQCFIF